MVESEFGTWDISIYMSCNLFAARGLGGYGNGVWDWGAWLVNGVDSTVEHVG